MVTFYLPNGQRYTTVASAPRKPGVFPLPYMGGTTSFQPARRVA